MLTEPFAERDKPLVEAERLGRKPSSAVPDSLSASREKPADALSAER
jgi:hypothetical protein